jgi:hypothetical protein
MGLHPSIDRIWFGTATVIFVVAALYPMRVLQVLNYGRIQGLPSPRVLLFFRLTAASAAVGGLLGFITGWVG